VCSAAFVMVFEERVRGVWVKAIHTTFVYSSFLYLAQSKEPQGGAAGIFFALKLESEWVLPKTTGGEMALGGHFKQQLQTELQGVTPIGGDTALEYLSVEVRSGVRVRLELLE
jgi:hypothetical protein